MRSLKLALIKYDCVLIKRENLNVEVEIQGECQTEGQLYCHKAKNTKDCSKPPEAKGKAWERVFLTALRRN